MRLRILVVSVASALEIQRTVGAAMLLLVPAGLLPARPVRAQGVMFANVTESAGVNYVHWTPDPQDPQYCDEPPWLIGGAAAGDYDGDGWADLYVTRILEPNLLFRNRGDGTFEELGAPAGVALTAVSSGCVWADVDNNGRPDLYVLTMDPDDRNYLYMNYGVGGFSESAVERGVDMAGIAEVRNCTSATFGDYDRDGDLDLHVVGWWVLGASNRLYRNDGSGHFEDVTAAAGVEMPGVWGFSNAFADMDGDGWPDLAVAADFGTSRLFRNLGSGSFEDITFSAGVGTDENGMGSTIADFDNDGDLDWFVTSIYDGLQSCQDAMCNWGDSGNRLYRNETGTLFSDATDGAGVRDGGWGWGASFLDYDNDGALDLAMTNGVVFPCYTLDDPFNTDPLRLWWNNNGVMTEVSAAAQFTDTGPGKGFVVVDYDRDGDEDVFIVNNAGQPLLLRNEQNNSNNWLQVALRGTQTNFFGIGARVEVQATASGPTQLREVNLNSNFMSHNEAAAHFGLGSGVSSVYLVRVQWPVSGLVQEVYNVAPNQRLLVEEACSPAGDANGDGVVDSADLAVVLAAWGPCPGCSADINGDGVAGPADLAQVLGDWGACT